LTVKDLETRKKLMRDALYSSYLLEITDFVSAGYYLENDLNPNSGSRERVMRALESFLNEQSPVLVSEYFDDEVTKITAEIEITSDGLHKSMNVIIDQALSADR